VAGAVEMADEIPLLIKTTAANYRGLKKSSARKHPYAVPN